MAWKRASEETQADAAVAAVWKVAKHIYRQEYSDAHMEIARAAGLVQDDKARAMVIALGGMNIAIVICVNI